MKNKNYSKILLLVGALLTVLSILVFAFFKGNTMASFTLGNLTVNLFIKAVVCAVLVFAVTTIYFCIRFKKKGFYLGVYSGVSALVNCVVAFALSTLCRAPLGNLTFAIMFFCVAVTYVTAVVFADNMINTSVKKNKKTEDTTLYDKAVCKTRKAFTVPFIIMIVTLVAGAVISFAFSAFSLALCAAPTILSAAYSFAFFLSWGGKHYADKA